jgi:hypothetical protein
LSVDFGSAEVEGQLRVTTLWGISGYCSVVVFRAPFKYPISGTRLFIPHPGFLAPTNVYSRRTQISPDRDTKMPDEEWIKTLEDGRKVKFIYQELPEDGAFITAQIEGNEVVYSVILTKARNPLSREDVESHFKGELSKK